MRGSWVQCPMPQAAPGSWMACTCSDILRVAGIPTCAHIQQTPWGPMSLVLQGPASSPGRILPP